MNEKEREALFEKFEKDELYLEELDSYLADPEKLEDFFSSIQGRSSVLKTVVLDTLRYSMKPAMGDHMLKWLEKEEDGRVKASLIMALGELKEERFADTFIGYLKSGDRRIRANAVEAMGKLRISRLRSHIEPLLQDDDNRVRANAAMALWMLPELQDRIREEFLSMLHNKDKWMKASAIYAFGELGLKEFIDYLFNYLRNEDEDICRNALIALIGFAERSSGREE